MRNLVKADRHLKTLKGILQLFVFTYLRKFIVVSVRAAVSSITFCNLNVHRLLTFGNGNLKC